MTKKIKTMAEMNAIFNKASKAERRVMIAEDVLLHITKKKIKPTNWTYFRLPMKKSRVIEPDESLQELMLSESKGACTACAIGALFYSKVVNYNACTTKQAGATANYTQYDVIVNDISMISNLKDSFAPKQLRLIELAFEGKHPGAGSYIHEFAGDLYHNCMNFHDKYNKASGRMRAIMKNIIKNKGTFKP